MTTVVISSFVEQNMYDISEEEEADLPLPDNWIRIIDVSKQILYKDTKFQLESEEHPYIFRALNAARKIPLPAGWFVKEILQDGEYDLFYYNSYFGISGWNPPHLRQCLSAILMREGYTTSSQKILIAAPPTTIENNTQANMKVQKLSITSIMNNANTKLSAISDTDRSNVDNIQNSPDYNGNLSSSADGKKQNIPTNENLPGLKSLISPVNIGPGKYESYNDDYSIGRDIETSQFYDINDETSRFQDHVSVGSTTIRQQQSVRSKKYMSLKDTTKHVNKRSANSVTSPNKSMNHSAVLAMKESSINEFAVTQLSNKVYQNNLLLHYDLCKVRYLFSKRLFYHAEEIKDKIPLHSSILIHAEDINDINENCNLDTAKLVGFNVHSYKQDVVNKMIELSSIVIYNIQHNPKLLLQTIAILPPGSADVHEIVYNVLHRIHFNWSTECNLTTALLLEAINFSIERMPSISELENFDEDTENEEDITEDEKVAKKLEQKYILLHKLMCFLYINQTYAEEAYEWNPLRVPLFEIMRKIYIDRQKEIGGDSPWDQLVVESNLTTLLKAYGIRRDVTSFFRCVWYPILPSIAVVLEDKSLKSNQVVYDILNPEPVTFPKLLSIAYRLLEILFSNENVIAFPSTIVALARCFSEISGISGTYIYILNFLILPNIIKLFCGQSDSVENEMPLKPHLLEKWKNKYYSADSWWPVPNVHFVEATEHNSIKILDKSNMIIFLVWRLFVCSLHCNIEILSKFTTNDFFKCVPITAILTEISNKKIRNMLHRLRYRINKSLENLINLPCDSSAVSFLEINTKLNLSSIQIPNKEIFTILKKRINNLLLLKCKENCNKIVVSRSECINIFDAIACILEKEQEKVEMERERKHNNDNKEEVGLGADNISLTYTHELNMEILNVIKEFIELCDNLDLVNKDKYFPQIDDMNIVDCVIDDIMLITIIPPDKSANIITNNNLSNEDEFSMMEAPAPPLPPMEDNEVPYPFTSSEIHEDNNDNDNHQSNQFMLQENIGGPNVDIAEESDRIGFHKNENGSIMPPSEIYIYDDDDSIVDLMGDGTPLPPPDDIEFQYKQLAFNYTLTYNYHQTCLILKKTLSQDESNANVNAKSIQSNAKSGLHLPNRSLISLVQNTNWLLYSELDFIVTYNMNPKSVKQKKISDSHTLSSARKNRDVGGGNYNNMIPFENHKKENESLNVLHNNFFHSLRFNNISKSAAAQTKLNTYHNPNLVTKRIMNNIQSPNILSYFKTKNQYKEYVEIQNKIKAKSNKSDDGQDNRYQSKYTKIEIPENSKLLNPTESSLKLTVGENNKAPPTLKEIHDSYMNSLRTHKPLPNKKKRLNNIPTNNISMQPHTDISSPSTVNPFPLALLSRIRRDIEDDSDGNGNNEENDRNKLDSHADFTDVQSRNKSIVKGSYSPNINVYSHKGEKVKKIPTPVVGSKSAFYAPTESLLNRITKEFEADTEITVKQEKGWKTLLRDYSDDASESDSKSRQSANRVGYQKNTVAPSNSFVNNNPFIPTGKGMSPIELQQYLVKHGKVSQYKKDDLLIEHYESRSKAINDLKLSLATNQRPSTTNSFLSQAMNPKFQAMNLKNEVKFEDYNDEFDESDDDENDDEVSEIDLGKTTTNQTKPSVETKQQDKESAIKTIESQKSFLNNLHQKDNSGSRVEYSIPFSASNKEHVSNRSSQDVSMNVQDSRNGHNESKHPATDIMTKVLYPPTAPIVTSHIQDTGKNQDKPLLKIHQRQQKKALEENQIELGVNRGSPINEAKSSSIQSTPIFSSSNPTISYTPKVLSDCDSTESQIVASESTEFSPTSEKSKSFHGSSFNGDKDDYLSEEKTFKHNVPVIKKQFSVNMKDLEARLVTGYVVLKHKLHGYPTKKLLTYNPQAKCVQWKPYNNGKQFSLKNIFGNSKSDSDVKSIPLIDIREVHIGIQTSIVLNKAGLVDPLCCMSIIADYRTLDITFDTSRQRDAVVGAIQSILERLHISNVQYVK